MTQHNIVVFLYLIYGILIFGMLGIPYRIAQRVRGNEIFKSQKLLDQATKPRQRHSSVGDQIAPSSLERAPLNAGRLRPTYNPSDVNISPQSLNAKNDKQHLIDILESYGRRETLDPWINLRTAYALQAKNNMDSSDWGKKTRDHIAGARTAISFFDASSEKPSFRVGAVH